MSWWGEALRVVIDAADKLKTTDPAFNSVPMSGFTSVVGPPSSAVSIGDQLLPKILNSKYEDIAQGGERTSRNAASATEGLRTLYKK